jgi:DNA-binding beta-propeller fold protein YncE
VVALAAGPTTQTVLPFDVGYVGGIAVDSTGTVYVTDFMFNKVLKLAVAG